MIYLSKVGGLICGAATTYIPEKGITLDMIQADLKHLVRRYEDERRLKIPHEGRIILRTETGLHYFAFNINISWWRCLYDECIE